MDDFGELTASRCCELANLLPLAVVSGLAEADKRERFALPFRWQPLLLLPLLVGVWHSVAVLRGAYFVRLSQAELLPSARLYWLERATEADPLNARWKLDRALLLEAWAAATGDERKKREALQLCEEVIRLQPTRSLWQLQS